MFLIRSNNMYLIWVIIIKKENNGEYPIYCGMFGPFNFFTSIIHP